MVKGNLKETNDILLNDFKKAKQPTKVKSEGIGGLFGKTKTVTPDASTVNSNFRKSVGNQIGLENAFNNSPKPTLPPVSTPTPSPVTSTTPTLPKPVTPTPTVPTTPTPAPIKKPGGFGMGKGAMIGGGLLLGGLALGSMFNKKKDK